MNAKKAKRLRKELKIDLKEERKIGRQLFDTVHKTQKNKDGSDKHCGLINDTLRRSYQFMKKFFK